MDYRTFTLTWSDAKSLNRIAEKQFNYSAIRSESEGDYPVRFTVKGENSLVICEKTENRYNEAKLTVFGNCPDWL